MKRVSAYIMDYIIMLIISILIRGFLFKDISNRTVLWWMAFLIIYGYFWVNDVLFCGSSVGKKIVGMKVVLKNRPLFMFAALHTLFKIAFSFIWPIAFMLFVTWHYTMPYDKYFYEKIE